MDNAGLPRKPAKLSASPANNIPKDDIPEALRDTPILKRPSRWRRSLLIIAPLGLGAIALTSAMLLPQSEVELAATQEQTETSLEASESESESESEANDLLGHLPYEEAPLSELQRVTADGSIKLRTAAANKFQEMSAAARRSGVILVPLSAFRSVAKQEYLFFEIKAQRGQVASKRAEVSAPPGYSEHHTGYAIDIGDAMTPATNLSPSFENTPAFKWLEQNAAYYSFEMSFPRDNPQGIDYEPWHWRFVGDSHSLETFYKAQKVADPVSNLSVDPTAGWEQLEE
ncbi:MAG: D-alanyl-D-alanine carboxypeptidase family protein [Symploca sp. SIO3C6]|uniref:D-alanyl-D-alanine carboxypeptidase family protein n=1 Tax=Symploca sp. SIO1C4 TaxID=2607765 RepID=A0A6B3NA31_9CYAN|nr:D-alanyl-D-alanine carboxypeptidase family protein [Symploca sp. SIO3C6]NER28517.1 D-alanyl-D-alanine carboxypeptidase family protein [Symploca sp. SIO1C4]